MSDYMRSLADISIGEHCFIESVEANGEQRRRLLDLGVIPNTKIEAVFSSLSGGVTAYLIRGTLIAIRRDDALNIIVKNFKSHQ